MGGARTGRRHHLGCLGCMLREVAIKWGIMWCELECTTQQVFNQILMADQQQPADSETPKLGAAHAGQLPGRVRLGAIN